MRRAYIVEYSYTVRGCREVMANDEDEACDQVAQKVADESGEINADEVEIEGVEEHEPSPIEFGGDRDDD